MHIIYHNVFYREVCVMNQHLPYYMAYPMPLVYDDERIERRDFEYMKSLYPFEVKRILPFVEEECERMSYQGSMIYDEYPDQLQLRMMCKRIYDKVEREEVADEHLKEIIQILLLQELYRRRSQNRKNRRIFY